MDVVCWTIFWFEPVFTQNLVAWMPLDEIRGALQALFF
jgi:hypothetical protein